MEIVEELLGSHPANALNKSQEGRDGVPKPVPCPSAGSTQEKDDEKMTDSEWRNVDDVRRHDGCLTERMGVNGEKSENVRMMNAEMMREMREIVGSFSLEKVEEQQPVQVNVGGQTLEVENLVSREQGN